MKNRIHLLEKVYNKSRAHIKCLEHKDANKNIINILIFWVIFIYKYFGIHDCTETVIYLNKLNKINSMNVVSVSVVLFKTNIYITSYCARLTMCDDILARWLISGYFITIKHTFTFSYNKTIKQFFCRRHKSHKIRKLHENIYFLSYFTH